MGLSRYVCRTHNETSEALSKGVGALEGQVGPWEGRSRDIPDIVDYLGARRSIQCNYNIVLYSLLDF